MAMVEEADSSLQHVHEHLDAGALMGVREVEVQLSHKEATQHVVIKVGRASVWAASVRLSIAAGFAQTAVSSTQGLFGNTPAITTRVGHLLAAVFLSVCALDSLQWSRTFGCRIHADTLET